MQSFRPPYLCVGALFQRLQNRKSKTAAPGTGAAVCKKCWKAVYAWNFSGTPRAMAACSASLHGAFSGTFVAMSLEPTN